MKNKFNELADKYQITAREYFYILRLAIYHTDHKQLDTSAEVAQYAKTPDNYECAIKIINAIGE